ncbi:MAG: Glycosyltransferase involved in cell wall bisynthesis [Candidatus Methanomarinus sp.]|nr:MAG: Glycosyltransferase involved in cell wall bisynthesis [ANME-2 cluster archaeon]KAF5425192.1 Glycosyltransferase involved in cell wall bisynthesis [ANME-2 cluster archaeon]
MTNIGIFLPEIDGIGGVEQVAYILARKLGVDIYTSWSRDDLDLYFPDISKYIINISNNNKKPSILSMINNFKSLKNPIDLMIYSYPRSIYFSIFRRDIPYLYYLGGIPHHFYLSTQEHKQYLGKISFKHYVDKMIWKGFTRGLDNQRVIANSKMIAAIYQNITGSQTKNVIYPPINTNQYKFKYSEDYYLSVTRFEAYKRIDWQIKAFEGTNENLIIIGTGPLFEVYSEYIKKHRLKNIILLNALPQDELIDYYSRCKAFIFTPHKEHFGMTPLEAMASGKPVISVHEGGPLEYVVEGVNGFYFDTISELQHKICTLSDEKLESMKYDCIKTAEMFDTSVFIKKIGELLKEYGG